MIFFLQVKASKALLDLREYRRTIEDSPKLLRSMAALLGEDEDEEERGEKDKHCIKEDRETDSGTYLSVKSNKHDADKRSDNKLPVTNLTIEVERQEELPFLLEEKRFMVYLCGGYKGKNEQILRIVLFNFSRAWISLDRAKNPKSRKSDRKEGN